MVTYLGRVRDDRLAPVSTLPVSGLKNTIWHLGFFVAYFMAGKLGIATALPPAGIVVIWPPNAIILATLLSVPRHQWPYVFLTTMAAEFAADFGSYPPLAAMGYGLVNFSEALLAVYLLSCFRTTGALRFMTFLAVGALASGVAALVGAGIYKLTDSSIAYLHYWRVFWFGDALGLLVIGTILLSWRCPYAIPRSPVEAAALATGLACVAGWALLTQSAAPRVYLIFPLLVWAALRFGVRGACLAVALTTVVAVGAAVHGYGPFVAMSSIDTVISLQGLIAVVTVSTFLLAFATQELEETNKSLDQLVATRTEELKKALAHNTLLYSELQHRVKNTLQIVGNFIGLQRNGAADAAKFEEVEGQVRAIGAVYDLLFTTRSNGTVDFCQTVPELCRKITAAHSGLISLSVEATGTAQVSPDVALALSLTLNELITNNIKHAGGQVVVHCGREGNSVVLVVAQEGLGFDINKGRGFGLRIARSMIEQAKGTMRMIRSDGFAIEIRVPID